MPDTIGNITVPSASASGTFPLESDYGYGKAISPEVAIHRFGSANAKIEQRFWLGDGLTRYTVVKRDLNQTDFEALRDFWEARKGPYQPFTYAAPSDDGQSTTNVTVRFENTALTFEHMADQLCSIGLTLIEVPDDGDAPSYTLNSTDTRFPSSSLETALLDQVQTLIPLVKVTVKESGYPVIYLSDRRCTVGGQLYQARLLRFDGISQSMNGEADDAMFIFGNADDVMRDLAEDTNLWRAKLEFSLFHVGTGIKLDLWTGEVVSFSGSEGAEFAVQCSDSIYELTLDYPVRTIERNCWKDFDDGVNCPYTSVVGGPETDCDKSWTQCQARSMNAYFGGVVARPQSVRIKDNSTGLWGIGRRAISSVSLVSDSIYGQPLQEIYTDTDMPVNCQLAAGREESEFYSALGIVGQGPISGYATDGTKHRLDGQPAHGPLPYGLRRSYGHDPVQNSDPDTDSDEFSLSAVGGGFTGDRAAGVAFVEVRRTDPEGLQLSRITEHQMQAWISSGLGGWKWTSGTRSWQSGLTNPVWIAINALLKAKALFAAAAATQETVFDVDSAEAAAAICDTTVDVVIGSGTETQFVFRGVLSDRRPLRDWLQEILNNCLGYYVQSNGKLKIGIRSNSSAAEAFTAGNIILDSLQLASIRPGFNHISGNYGDSDFEWKPNTISIGDIDHAKYVGSDSGPQWLKSQLNLVGVSGMSQAARIVTTRLREEIGGISAAEWKAARQISYGTTVLALAVEPGMVCSLTDDEMPGGSGEFRVLRWRLNPDYSITIEGRTTTDNMYDLTVGPKPADATPDAVPDERIIDLMPGDVTIIDATVSAEDGKEATVDITYSPPGTDETDIGTFSGVHIHYRVDGSGDDYAPAGDDAGYNGDAGGAGSDRYGTARIRIPQPVGSNADYEIAVGARSRVYRKKLDDAPTTVVTITGVSFLTAGRAGVVTGVSADVNYQRDPHTGNPVGQGEISFTPPTDAGDYEGTYYRLWWAEAASEPDLDEYDNQAAKLGSPLHTSWYVRPEGATPRRFYYKIVSNSDYVHASPEAGDPGGYFEIEEPSAPDQVSGFSVSLVQQDGVTAYSTAKPVRLKWSLTIPSDAEFWNFRVDKRKCDASWTPVGDWQWSGDYAEGPAAGAYSEAMVDSWELPPTEEYWEFRAYSQSHVGVLNETSPPTYQLTVPARTVGDGLVIDSDGATTLGTENFVAGVMNPSFEKGLDLWSPGTGTTIETADSYTGSNSLKIPVGGTDSYNFSSHVQCRPGDQFYAEAWVKKASADADFQLKVLYLDSDKSTPVEYQTLDTVSTAASWTKSSGVSTAPANASWARLVLFVPSGSTGYWLIDNVKLTSQIFSDQLPEGVINALNKFDSGIRPVAIVASLPSLPDADYPVGCTVVLTTDGYVYRNVAGSWSKTVSAKSLTEFNTTEFEIDATQGFRQKQVNAEKVLIGTTLKVGGGASPRVGQMAAYDGSDVMVFWAGTNGGYYGAWGKKFYAGGTSPADAPLYVSSGGNVVLATASGYQPTITIITAGGGTLNIATDASYPIQLTDSTGYRVTQVGYTQFYTYDNRYGYTYASLTLGHMTLQYGTYSKYSYADVASGASANPSVTLAASGSDTVYLYGGASPYINVVGGSYKVSGNTAINSSNQFVGYGANHPGYPIQASSFNPYVGGVQYYGATGSFTSSDGKTVTVKAGAVSSIV